MSSREPIGFPSFLFPLSSTFKKKKKSLTESFFFFLGHKVFVLFIEISNSILKEFLSFFLELCLFRPCSSQKKTFFFFFLDSAFRQQKLKAWQPILTPSWVIGSFFSVGLIFVVIGFILLGASNGVRLGLF